MNPEPEVTVTLLFSMLCHGPDTVYALSLSGGRRGWRLRGCCGWWGRKKEVYFLGLHLGHMEIPRLGVELELQLQAYAIATATQDPSHIQELHHSNTGSLTH